MEKFGTDGIRGKYKQEITHDLALRMGLAVAKLKAGAKVVVGRDNRPGSKELALSICYGLSLGGATVTNVQICSSPCISYLSMQGYDYGVMITASHNPPEYNGIKLFGSNGIKTSRQNELKIEELLQQKIAVNNNCIGKIISGGNQKQKYINFLKLIKPNYSGKIVIDCSRGASQTIAKKVFGTSASYTGLGGGKNINKNCGATHPEHLLKVVQNKGADIGFAFDGDADRIIVATKNHIYDGDNILFALSKYFLQTRKKFDSVVATIMSNMGLEKTLKPFGVNVCYTDVGDKYVIRQMQQNGYILGGESSGHIISSEFLPTGDGVLAALLLLHAQKHFACSFDELLSFDKFVQHELSYKTNNKTEIIKNQKFQEYYAQKQEEINGFGRIIVRPSGTEPKIRIMVETINAQKSEQFANQIYNYIQKLETELCAE